MAPWVPKNAAPIPTAMAPTITSKSPVLNVFNLSLMSSGYLNAKKMNEVRESRWASDYGNLIWIALRRALRLT